MLKEEIGRLLLEAEAIEKPGISPLMVERLLQLLVQVDQLSVADGLEVVG
jgi:hypothetical protein